MGKKKGEFFSERFPYVKGVLTLQNVEDTAAYDDIQKMPFLEVHLQYKGEYRKDEVVVYRAERDAGGGWSCFHEKTFEDMSSGRDPVPAMVRFHLMGVQPLVSAMAPFAAAASDGASSKFFIAGSFVAQMPNDAGLWGVEV